MESRNKQPLMTQAARDKAAADSKAAEMRAAQAKVADEAFAAQAERDMAERDETARKRVEAERVEAERVRIAAAETASQRAAMRMPDAVHAPMPAQPAAEKHEVGAEDVQHTRTKVWILTPRDVNEPPFHFTGVPMTVVVRAASETEARNHAAAGEVEPNGAAWQDKKLSSCVDAAIGPAGLIARDMDR